MIDLEDRQALARDISDAHTAGARLELACEIAGISLRTLQRWQADEGQIREDGRPSAARPMPAHALSEEERAKLLAVANEPRFADVPPARIVPMLADEGGLSGKRIDFQPRAQSAWATQALRTGQSTEGKPPAHHAHCDGATPSLVLGYDLSAGSGDGPMVLSLPHPRSLQSQDRRLGGT